MASIPPSRPQISWKADQKPVPRSNVHLLKHQTVDKAHGRIETRTIHVLPAPPKIKAKWQDAEQICRIKRIREIKGKKEVQVIHAITSLSPEAADATRLLQMSRDHWAIENRHFHVRDVSFAEDASRVRKGNAPRAMALIRSTVLNLIRRKNLKPRAAREDFAAKPKAAIREILKL